LRVCEALMSSLTRNHGDYEFGNEYRPHWVAAKLPLATGRSGSSLCENAL